MRVPIVLIVGALFASNAGARIGETSDEAAKRYGPPLDSHAGAYSNTIARVYNKDGIRVEATFITSGSGKIVIGEIRYSLPKEMGQSNAVAKVVLLQLLDANAAGQQWDIQNNLPATQIYHRPGVTATLTPNLLTVTLDEYAALVGAEKNSRVTEQSDRIDKHLNEF